jgi:adenylosuccinate lyase
MVKPIAHHGFVFCLFLQLENTHILLKIQAIAAKKLGLRWKNQKNHTSPCGSYKPLTSVLANFNWN